MERIITNRLVWHLEKNNLLNAAQSGFRQRRSTIDHLVRIADQINKSINNRQYTVATYLDFSNAFDLLYVKGLLKKLSDLNITGQLYNWIAEFLNGRKIRVRVGASLSDSYKLENGSPQGSVLSPILFLILINDIPQSTDPQASASLFADDTAVWRTGPNLEFAIKKTATIAGPHCSLGGSMGLQAQRDEIGLSNIHKTY